MSNCNITRRHRQLFEKLAERGGFALAFLVPMGKMLVGNFGDASIFNYSTKIPRQKNLVGMDYDSSLSQLSLNVTP